MIIAKDRGHITDDNKLSHGALFILQEFETLLSKTKKSVASDVLGTDSVNRINEYRNMFPAAKLPSGELGRQSVQELKDKFVWFFKTYPEYDWNLVLDATDYYIYTKQKDNYMYMVTSSYFIQKTDTKSKVSKSLLADYCQMLLDNPAILSTH